MATNKIITAKKKSKKRKSFPKRLPFIPLKDIVLFPYMVLPLFIGRDKSVAAVYKSIEKKDRLIVLGTQTSSTIEEPQKKDIYPVAVIAEILQILKLPDGTLKILVEGIQRVKIDKFFHLSDPVKGVEVSLQPIKTQVKNKTLLKAYLKELISLFEEYLKVNQKIPLELLMVLKEDEDAERVADLITAHLSINVQEKIELLEKSSLQQRLEELAVFMKREIEISQLERKIHHKVQKKIEKIQKEYYLREQLKAIHQELGGEDEWAAQIKELKEKLEEKGLPENVLEKAQKEIKKLESMMPGTPETTVSLNYLEWLLELPWEQKTEDSHDIEASSKILNEDHYGLEKTKERILEFLAVQQLKNKVSGTILCFVGPPGVGKTSLGKSIARALNRKFVRMSLGGVRDEAEIRGHRKTYIGAMPGRIIQLLRRAGSSNPVFILDEVDKMSMDFRGDPSAALLEVLDPEQNSEFEDHYLGVPYDLSDVMFITTANDLYSIPHPLRDRMEVITIPGYIEEEKIEIAKKHLLPKELKNNGLEKYKIRFSTQTLSEIIRYYTREAGVRNLQRLIGNVLRKIAKKIVQQKLKLDKRRVFKVEPSDVKDYLGPRKFTTDPHVKKKKVGVVNGLAWTSVGGVTLRVEAAKMEGKGKLKLTGQLGDVMTESAQIAYSYLFSKAKDFAIKSENFTKFDVHIHVPENAIPKDGPSAGVTMTTALYSLFKEKPARSDFAMTGEVTLIGEVLPIGGVKEKVLAAVRAGIKKVILPSENEKDITDIPEKLRKKVKFFFVSDVKEVLKLVVD
jgi:ATP-dependent Lon protease